MSKPTSNRTTRAPRYRLDAELRFALSKLAKPRLPHLLLEPNLLEDIGPGALRALEMQSSILSRALWLNAIHQGHCWH